MYQGPVPAGTFKSSSTFTSLRGWLSAVCTAALRGRDNVDHLPIGNFNVPRERLPRYALLMFAEGIEISAEKSPSHLSGGAFAGMKRSTCKLGPIVTPALLKVGLLIAFQVAPVLDVSTWSASAGPPGGGGTTG